ncbi:MAG: hypothetical protein H6662_15720 [Ardenticatenaceae bacterium]|nr:hypothetical protein [Anaerolineales bacterium]MCB8923036.1 hypothetical protein [Ardenticatenaceae bacterium]
MSWQALTAVSRHSTQANLGQFRLLLYLAEYADDAGVIDPAPNQTTMAERFNCTGRTIRNRINNLCADGELVQTRIGSGPGNPSAYHILLPMPEIKAENKGGKAEANPVNFSAFEGKGKNDEPAKAEANPAFLSAFAELKAEILGIKAEILELKAENKGGKGGKAESERRKAHSTKSADDPLITNVVVINDLKTATTTPAHAHAKQLQPDTTNPKVVEAVLNWLGFVGNIQAEIAQHNLTAETALGWAFWMRLNQERMAKRERDPLAITIASWRKGANLPADLRRLARAWLAMNDQERRLALDAAETSRYAGKLYLPQVLLTFDLPPDTLRKLYMAHEAFAPPSLMPPPPASAEDEEPAPPVLRPTPIPPKTSYEMSVDEAAVWESTLGELELQMTKQTFATWLKDSKLHLNGIGAQVLVRNDYAAQWINGRLADTVARTLSAVAGKPLSITAVVDGAS